MRSVIFTQNVVTSCPYLGEPHGLRILAADGLHHALHGFQLTKVFQNYHLARAFLNWDEREGVLCEMFCLRCSEQPEVCMKINGRIELQVVVFLPLP